MKNKWIDYFIRLVIISLSIVWFFMLYSDSSMLVLLAIVLLIGTTLYLIVKEQSDFTTNVHNLKRKFNHLHFKK
ncbi:hypothetical protein [Companilactobacillus mishanensis]|uniref:Uncharacterized protein n=1 Tax=Companilactobacillus mishanensis TaxID=2486008 RepID=A0A5P0ZK58_9LACO|nr:hypothetical protein [Companilactobacillus mishanensis]MQS45256.1 hypothetical protein [Companilactobacillus mishanensis]MQS53432.1 hypothetical protein [Companilactobacillus mishanensis]MQS89650.1 hypothetical protein [Companilactobacillus mishanensis]